MGQNPYRWQSHSHGCAVCNGIHSVSQAAYNQHPMFRKFTDNLIANRFTIISGHTGSHYAQDPFLAQVSLAFEIDHHRPILTMLQLFGITGIQVEQWLNIILADEFHLLQRPLKDIPLGHRTRQGPANTWYFHKVFLLFAEHGFRPAAVSHQFFSLYIANSRDQREGNLKK